ncbi:Alpha/Beta hydrolase protein [Xylariaceae sp. FL0255]|nr:Alpha/Beta hydrolase protein [Xylariaceae sp. FL0255]
MELVTLWRRKKLAPIRWTRTLAGNRHLYEELNWHPSKKRKFQARTAWGKKLEIIRVPELGWQNDDAISTGYLSDSSDDLDDDTMASPDSAHTYKAKLINPHVNDYDAGLQEHSTNECHEMYNSPWHRDRWTHQRQKREAREVSDVEISERYGLIREAKAVSRVVSAQDPENNFTKENIDVVIVHSDKTRPVENLPCIFFIHGGCRIGGTEYSGGFLARAQEWGEKLNAIAVSVAYRLSPYGNGEPTDEEPTNDCFDALKWTYDQLGKGDGDTFLRYGDRSKLVVFGTSSGGGLAASVAMKWTQTPGVGKLCGILLEAPQLDDRCNTKSHDRFKSGNMFTSMDARLGWEVSLGKRRGGNDVNIFEAPARAAKKDVEGFPPTYIDVGAAEPFRDEVIRFSDLLITAGVEVERHVFSGGFHGFFAANPNALVSRLCNARKMGWLSRRLGVTDGAAQTIRDECNELQGKYNKRNEELKGLSYPLR